MKRYDTQSILQGAYTMHDRTGRPIVDCIATQTDSGTSFFDAVKHYARFSGGMYPHQHERMHGREQAKRALYTASTTK